MRASPPRLNTSCSVATAKSATLDHAPQMKSQAISCPSVRK